MGKNVSAELLQDPPAPSNLKKGLAPTNKDRKIWGDAYDKQYNGLNDLDTSIEISEVEYQRLVKTYGDKAANCNIRKSREKNLVKRRSIHTNSIYSLVGIIDLDGSPGRTLSQTRRLEECFLSTKSAGG